MNNDRLIRLHNTQAALRGAIAAEADPHRRNSLREELETISELLKWLRAQTPATNA